MRPSSWYFLLSIISTLGEQVNNDSFSTVAPCYFLENRKWVTLIQMKKVMLSNKQEKKNPWRISGSLAAV